MSASALMAQGPRAPAFEVASVKANRSDAPMQLLPTLQPGGRVFAINLPLREWIQVAYGLRQNELIMPSPLAEARFDLEARAGANATREQAGLMLQALLTERFGLKTHGETRQLPVYTLERVNASRLGERMKRSGTECAPLTFPSGPGAPPPPPPPPANLAGTPLGPSRVGAQCPTMFMPGGWSVRSMDMEALSIALERRVRRQVIDKTGLSGLFDFDLTYEPEIDEFPFPAAIVGGSGAPAAPSQRAGPSLVTALRDQLGLRLESRRAPADVVVVDDVRLPRDN
jgi:uncharacterized protein (TIGR03435 family)